MKKNSNTYFTTLSKVQIENLTNVIKETLASGFDNPVKLFTAAELWNIQRQGKSRVQRRFLY